MKTIHVFVGVDMRQSHLGLTKLASQNKIDLNTMQQDSAIVFISRDRMRMKAYSGNGVLSYLVSSDRKRPFDLQAIDEFPKAFDKNGTMNYEKALKERLKKALFNKTFDDTKLL